jgi:hypothetical protein
VLPTPTQQQEDTLIEAYMTLEGLFQEYKGGLLWFLYGKHKTTRPIRQETQEGMKELKETIIAVLTTIEAETQ